MPRIELYPFRYRHPLTGKWVRARYKAERHEIAERFTEWEITGPPDIIEVDPRARYFTPYPRQYTREETIANVRGMIAIMSALKPLRLTLAGVAT